MVRISILVLENYQSSELEAVLENKMLFSHFLATGAFLRLMIFFLTSPYYPLVEKNKMSSILECTLNLPSFRLMMLMLHGINRFFHAQ